MKSYKLAFLATSALVGNFIAAGAAHAQSTASTAVETIVVTGQSGPADVAGIQAQTEAKNRVTITQELIETQTPGQTIIDTLAVVTPGLNFTNNDPYGTSGGNIRLHGFDGNRVALTFDGMPLNDTGNYATFTNQLLDNELISSAQVNTGATDVDSPTAASTGGTINFSSRTPSDEFHGFAQLTHGDFNYNRYMFFVDTGEIYPGGTKAWASLSYQNYDKFKGKGELEKLQYNAKIYQPIGDGSDFVSVAFHWNQNRNNNYYSANLGRVNANGTFATGFLPEVQTNPLGWELDFRPTYRPDTVTTRTGFAGDIDVAENTENGATRGYYGLRVNPSNTGNIRGQSKFSFGDSITLTIDPSFQYVLANGGTQNTTLWESCNSSSTSNTAANCPAATRQLLGSRAISANGVFNGVDLNNDGDLNDLVRVMNPSNTNTRRYGLLSSLIWELNDDHLIRGGYTLDYGRHRQTGDFGFVQVNGDQAIYDDYFGGKDGQSGTPLLTADGIKLQNRDRFSIALLNQLSVEYRGNFLNDNLAVNIGLRAPFFKRELNQYCYSQNGSTNVRCTTETPNATLANGNVTFAGGTTQFIAPYEREVEYDAILPNVGASYFLGDSQFFASYAESTSLPRTDNLYTVFRNATATSISPFTSSVAEPETSQTIEGGYRYNGGNLQGSVAYWNTTFQNRIVSSFDQDLGINIDRNVGEVKQQGVDASVGWSPVDMLSAYLTASWNDSEVQSDIQTGRTSGGVAIFTPTKGKKIAETPEWTFSTRLEFRPIQDLQFGLQAKYVDERFVTDTNDQSVDAYTLVDFDARYSLEGLGFENTSVRVNVNNVFDERYYGSISSQTNSTVGQVYAASTPFANIGAPRTASVSLRVGF